MLIGYLNNGLGIFNYFVAKYYFYFLLKVVCIWWKNVLIKNKIILFYDLFIVSKRHIFRSFMIFNTKLRFPITISQTGKNMLYAQTDTSLFKKIVKQPQEYLF